MGFIFARVFCVLIYGAWVHDESLKPIRVLHSIPAQYYSPEVGNTQFLIYIIVNVSVVHLFIDIFAVLDP